MNLLTKIILISTLLSWASLAQSNKVLLRKSLEQSKDKYIHKGYIKLDIEQFKDFKSLKKEAKKEFLKSLITQNNPIESFEMKREKDKKFYKMNFSYKTKLSRHIIDPDLATYVFSHPKLKMLSESLNKENSILKNEDLIKIEYDMYLKGALLSDMPLKTCDIQNDFINAQYQIKNRKKGILIKYNLEIKEFNLEANKDAKSKEAFEKINNYLKECSTYTIAYNTQGKKIKMTDYLIEHGVLLDKRILQIFVKTPLDFFQRTLGLFDKKYHDSTYYYFLSRYSLLIKDYKNALKYADLSIKIKPIFSKAPGQRLLTYGIVQPQKEHKEIIKQILKEYSPTEFMDNLYVARYYYKKEMYDKAQKYYENSLTKIKDDDSISINNYENIIFSLLKIYNDAKNYEGIVRINKLSLKVLPTRKAQAHAAIIKSYRTEKHINRAYRYVKKTYIPQKDKYLLAQISGAYSDKAQSMLEGNADRDKVISLLKKSLKISNNVDAHYLLATIDREDSLYQQAFDHYIEAIKLNQNIRKLYQDISGIIIFDTKNDEELMKTFFKEMAKLDKKIINSRMIYLCTHFVNKKVDGTAKFCKMAAKNYPLNTDLSEKISKL